MQDSKTDPRVGKTDPHLENRNCSRLFRKIDDINNTGIYFTVSRYLHRLYRFNCLKLSTVFGFCSKTDENQAKFCKISKTVKNSTTKPQNFSRQICQKRPDTAGVQQRAADFLQSL